MRFVCLRYPKIQMTFKTDIKREVNGEILKEPADVIRFENGYYETDDPKKIAFIKRHTDFGVTVHVVEEVLQTAATEKEIEIIEKHRGRPKKIE